MNKAMRCLWLVAWWSMLMVSIMAAVLALLASVYWLGYQIAQALGLDNAWFVPIGAIITMAIYGAGVGALECRSKLKRGEL